MQATENWEGSHFSHSTRVSSVLLRIWNSLVDALMRPSTVEILHVLAQHTSQMSLTDDHHVVEAVAPNASEQSLANRICTWRFDRCSQHLNRASCCDSLEMRAIFCIIIPDQICRRLTEGCCLTELLSNPFIGRGTCDGDVYDAPRAKLGNDEGEEWPKENVGHLEEIAGPDVSGVVAEEGGPGLTRWSWWPSLSHVALNRALGDLDADLEQFAADALGTPETVVRCHLLDQADGLGRELRVARPRARFPFPDQAEAFPMPTQDSLGLDDEERFFPGLQPAGEGDEEASVGPCQAWPFGRTGEDEKLLAEQQVFCDSCGFVRPRSATVPSAGW